MKEGQKVKHGKEERTGRSRHNTIPRKPFKNEWKIKKHFKKRKGVIMTNQPRLRNVRWSLRE